MARTTHQATALTVSSPTIVRAACVVCGETFEAPEEYADLVYEGATDCAIADADWRSALLAEIDGAVA